MEFTPNSLNTLDDQSANIAHIAAFLIRFKKSTPAWRLKHQFSSGIFLYVNILHTHTEHAQTNATYYRPPGGRLYDLKVLSGYAFLRTYYVLKKLTANHAAAIMRDCARETRLSP